MLLANYIMQLLTYYAINSLDEEDDSAAKKIINVLGPVLVPILSMSLQTIIFDILRVQIANAAQDDYAERMLVKNYGRNIGLIESVATVEMLRDIQKIGKHIDHASYSFFLLKDVSNVVTMGIYWHSAYRSLPEAHNILYGTTVAIATACYLHKMLLENFRVTYYEQERQDMNWETRMAQNTRHAVATVFSNAQSTELATLNQYTNLKRAAELEYLSSGTKMVTLRNGVTLCLPSILNAAVDVFQPQLKSAKNISKFIFSLSQCSDRLNSIMAQYSQNYSRSLAGLQKLEQVNKLLAELDELHDSKLCTIKYAQKLGANIALQLENFTMAIPVAQKKQQPNTVFTVLQKVNNTLKNTDSRFILQDENISFEFGNVYMVYGPSGIGKSTFLKILFGIWPYTKGGLEYACEQNQIYAMPQNQMFIPGTLLENIFYPSAVPENFAGSAEEERLHKLMRILDLDREIERLYENTNWSSDLSRGLQQRISVIRFYFKMTAMKPDATNAPKILLLDEMTAGLDGANAATLERLVCQMREDFPMLCIIFIRHNEKIDLNSINQTQRDFLTNTTRHKAGLTPNKIVNLAPSAKPVIFSQHDNNSNPLTLNEDDADLGFCHRCTIC